MKNAHVMENKATDEDYAVRVDETVFYERSMPLDKALEAHVPVKRHEAVKKILQGWHHKEKL